VKDISIPPVEAIERHHDHIPLETDSIIQEWIANEASRDLKIQ